MITRTRRTTRLALAALAAVTLGIAGCADTEESSSDGDPAATTEEVKAPDGTELVQVTLAPGSAKQLGIRFVPITQEGADLSIPIGALVYSPDGGEWVYTEVEPNSFLRQRVTVREIVDGKTVLLSDGPEPGTEVVTRGTIELYGVEEGIGA